MARRRAYTKKAVNDFSKQLTKRVEDYQENLLKRTDEAVGWIMELSDRYVPEDTLLTKNSAWVEPAKFEKGRLITRFGYDLKDEVDYINIIWDGVRLGEPIRFRKVGAQAMWLDVAFNELKDKVYNHISKG